MWRRVDAETKSISDPSGSASSSSSLSSSVPFALALDIGTSGVRASLYTDAGQEIPGTQSRLVRDLSTTPDGGVEIDAEEAVEQVVRTVDAALALLSDPELRIEAAAVACFWHSLVGVNAEGRAVTPLMGWADTRAASDADELRRRFDETAVHARTGARFHPSYWPARFLHLTRTEPEIFQRVARWMSFGEFLALRLCNQARASVSMASGTGLLNLRTCAWDEELLRHLQLEPEQLPPIAETDETFETLRDEYARRWPALRETRWFPAIGDGAANSIGAGCTTRERAALMIGTSGAMRVLWEGDVPEALPPALWCYRADRRRIVTGGALSDGGNLWAWMTQALRLDARGESADVESLESEIAAIGPDAHGLTVLPFWAGERSTGWEGHARGAILGLTMHTHPLEILRAAMEAVAYRFALISRALSELAPEAEVVATGGALRASTLWTKMIADVLGRPISLSGVEECSSRGAVLLALEASGKIKSICDMEAPLAETFEPDAARHKLYSAGLLRQQKIYERLVPFDLTL